MFIKLKPFAFPFIILITGIVITWIVIWKMDFINDRDKAITLTVSCLGLFFGLFQVFLNLAVQNIRNLNQLRYNEYKSVASILAKISETMNDHMIEEKDAHSLVNALINQINQFVSFILTNDDYLFPKIKIKKVAKDVHEHLESILVRTDKFRKELEDLDKKAINPDKANAVEFEKLILRMNWHNEVRETLNKYNLIKYDLLTELQKYFK